MEVRTEDTIYLVKVSQRLADTMENYDEDDDYDNDDTVDTDMDMAEESSEEDDFE